MIARARYQDLWSLHSYRAMQAAIGQQLKAELEPPEDLTPELIVFAKRLDKQEDEGGRALRFALVDNSRTTTLLPVIACHLPPVPLSAG